MTGISIGSYLKDPQTMALSSTLGMWGTLQLFAFGGQTFLAYQKQVLDVVTVTDSVTDSSTDNTTTTNSTTQDSNSTTEGSSTSTSRRRLDESIANIYPFVFYGSAAAFFFKLCANISYFFVHTQILRKDKGY